jgi:hypothetical protein
VRDESDPVSDASELNWRQDKYHCSRVDVERDRFKSCVVEIGEIQHSILIKSG